MELQVSSLWDAGDEPRYLVMIFGLDADGDFFVVIKYAAWNIHDGRYLMV